MMNKVLRSCVVLWGLGLAGIWVARAVLALEPCAPLCRITAAAWILGGAGYLGFGGACLIASARSRASVGADSARMAAPAGPREAGP